MQHVEQIFNEMEIKRDMYLQQLIDSRGNGMIKGRFY